MMNVQKLEKSVTQTVLDAHGHNRKLPAKFCFRWAGIVFDGRIQTLDENRLSLDLTARLGRVPFTAEDKPARLVFQKAPNPTQNLNNGHYYIDEKGYTTFSASTSFPGPLVAETLLRVLVITLLQIRPYLRRFEN